jgi:hypothetical protein
VFDITNVVRKTRWKGRTGSSGRSLIVTVLDDDGYKHARTYIDVVKGHQCMFFEDGKELFRGIITSTVQSNKKTMTFTAYDIGIYLANNKDTFCYEKKTADAVFTDVMSRLGLNIGTVAKCTYVIPGLIKRKTTAFDTISDALSLDYDNSKTRHYVSCSQGKISLLNRSENVVKLVIEPGSNLITYSYSNSIENIKTRIKLLSDEGKVLAEERNAELESRIGVFQDVDTPDETLTKAQINSLAKSLLSEKCNAEQTFTLEAMGVSTVISGVMIYVKLDHLGISRAYYVDEDTHTWDGNNHTMTLKLSCANDT